MDMSEEVYTYIKLLVNQFGDIVICQQEKIIVGLKRKGSAIKLRNGMINRLFQNFNLTFYFKYEDIKIYWRSNRQILFTVTKRD